MPFAQSIHLYGHVKIKYKMLIKRILKNHILVKKKQIIICIDGITCSGKTSFSNFLKKELKNNKKITCSISKDLFLISRFKRIQIIKKLKKVIFNQNKYHYNHNKINRLISEFKKIKKRKIKFCNLYDRKTGLNLKKKTFQFKKIDYIIYEGIYSVKDLNRHKLKPDLTILMINDVYDSLITKIKRIRDSKISVGLVVKEFLKIHLTSFFKYISKTNYDYIISFSEGKMLVNKNFKSLHMIQIKRFLQKHL